MNILIPHSWLKDYIETDLDPKEIAKLLSLHSFSVEKISPVGDDYIYEIEITPNRGDALSIIGIARELKAIISKQKQNIIWHQKIYDPIKAKDYKDELIVQINNKSLVPRFSAIVLDNVIIKDSPDFIKNRLEKIGIRAINNVVDITNYMMIDKGQPMHSFDYDKISKHMMIVRESQKDEEIITLDGVKRTLPNGVIVIEDGDKKLIDLCGIMGGKNSEIDNNTKKVLLFVQEYDPVRIRKASMTLGHRTDAAVRFEKGIDHSGIISSLWQAVNMINEYANSNISSKLIDIINVQYPPKKILIDTLKIKQIAGVDIDNEFIYQTLSDLGFEINQNKALVPSWRYDDINISEDLAEEVIRLFGYYNIPDNIPTTDLPLNIDNHIFDWGNIVKNYLKYQGFFECYTYSSTTENNAGSNAIKISNPLSEELKYLKQSLIPQLIDILDKNQGYSENIRLYELASVYLPELNDLPKQPLKLGFAVKNLDIFIFKGIIEGLFDEMGIIEYPLYTIKKNKNNYLTCELDFEELVKLSSKTKTYTPITSFNSIKEDITLVVPFSANYKDIKKIILNIDQRIIRLSFKGIYQNNLTLSLEYLDRQKQISSEDTQVIREKIFDQLENNLKIKLKQ